MNNIVEVVFVLHETLRNAAASATRIALGPSRDSNKNDGRRDVAARSPKAKSLNPSGRAAPDVFWP